ncbi:MAG: hypothetical protein KDD58_03920 [Bdellovibrionales bacterium]|nr:hypothetical protein [Bdellovibrionales bacterium]
MKLNVKAIAIIVSTGFFLMMFQNCGNELDSNLGEPGDIEKVDGTPEQINELSVEDAIQYTFNKLDQVDIEDESVKTELIRLCTVAKLISYKHEINEQIITDVSNNEEIEIFSAEEIELVENIRARTLLLGRGGMGSSRHIHKIRDFEGDLIICEMTVGAIEEFHGRAVVVNGGVGDVNVLSGTLKLVNSPLMGITENVSGKIQSN